MLPASVRLMRANSAY